jgi:hypothetical protein
MTIQLGTTLRNNRAAQLEATLGPSAKVQIRTGAQPANCAAADSGTLLAEITLPADYLTAPSGGVVSQIGTWEVAAVAAGTAGHFRGKDSAGSVCSIQGSVTATGGGGDMTIDNVSIAVSQLVRVTSFTSTEGGA